MNQILQRVDQAKHIVVIAHINPDADSIGSASAFYTHLLRLHKKVSFFCSTNDINKNLSFLPWFDKIRSSFPTSADLAIAFDCATQNRLGVKIECDLINIDHHLSNNGFGDIALVDPGCISTTQVLYNLFKENEIIINKKMATGLYAGLLDDSKAFMDDGVDGTIFALVNELISLGADYKLCNKFINKRRSLGAFRLKAIMYKNMQLFNEARVAVFCVSIEDMKASGALGNDCEYALEESLYIPTVEVALLLKQNKDFTIKGSLRSNGLFDVSKIASEYGGGGHATRAGFNITDIFELEKFRDVMLKIIYKEM